MNQLFYFNGFNSAILPDYSGNAKISAVAAFCEKSGFEFIPVSTDYRRVLEHRDTTLDRVHTSAELVVFSGSSMGGWFARIMQLTLAGSGFEGRVVAFAFNPMYDVAAHKAHLLGTWENYVTGKTQEWTRAHGDSMSTLEQSVEYDAPHPFFVYCDKGDEVIGWEGSAARHAGMAEFTAFEGGSHSFEHYHEALEDFHRQL